MNGQSLEEAVEQLCASVTNEFNKRTPPQSENLTIQLDHEEGVVTIPRDLTPIDIHIQSLDPYLLLVDTDIEQVEFADNNNAAEFVIDEYLGEDAQE